MGCSMFIMSEKLKNLKVILKVWNKNHFGNITLKIRSSKRKLNLVQDIIQVFGYSDDLRA